MWIVAPSAAAPTSMTFRVRFFSGPSRKKVGSRATPNPAEAASRMSSPLLTRKAVIMEENPQATIKLVTEFLTR
jgi:hypothetical protein